LLSSVSGSPWGPTPCIQLTCYVLMYIYWSLCRNAKQPVTIKNMLENSGMDD
jgi:hypothetical protein